MPLMIWAFCYSLTSELNFNFILLLMDSWLVKSIEVLFIWALLHHLIAGLRHLLLDFQIGTDLIVARLSSKTVLIVSFMLTALSVNWI
jgi:succinate dehydrogenase / fumarate reductase cytochrome b subunit